VGIDVAEKVGHIMIDAFGSRMEPPAIMQKLVDDGRAGRKNGKGFYLYGGDKKKEKEVDPTVYQVLGLNPMTQLDPTELAERCALQLVNEAMLCFGEGIVRTPRDGDIGAIFGLGFPPFRGGPFRYVDTVGAAEIVKKLETFAERLGPRFTPAPVLVDMARSGKKFYPEG
jgi:3-hydroxyacyl-CoA dehydrogenase/enoyl-CoA hydratase/3-hydroxybutyryl-CoA epimerase